MLVNIKRRLAEKILTSSSSSSDINKLSSLLCFTPVQKNTKLEEGLISIPKSVLHSKFNVSPENLSACSITEHYVNYTVPSRHLIKSVISDITRQGASYGKVGVDERSLYHVGDDGGMECLKRKLNVVVDYSSPNIAKPFHMGHLRSTVIGRFVVNINKHFDQSTTSVNYLGDWGTQFGYLSEGFKRFGNEEEMTKHPIQHLQQVYTQINKDTQPDVHTNAMRHFKQLEEGDEEMTRFWRKCREVSLKEYSQIYQKLDVGFDVWLSESMWSDAAKKLVVKLLKEGVVKVDGDGVTYMKTDADDKAVLLKSDQSSLYLTRDLASALDRLHTYKAHKLVYVVDRSQERHFKQLQSCLQTIHQQDSLTGRMMEGGMMEGGMMKGGMKEEGRSDDKRRTGREEEESDAWDGLVEHVMYGRIEGMSSRKGVGVLLAEVVERVAEKMVERMKNKKTTKVTSGADVTTTASSLGITAIVVNDLKRGRMNNYTFDWDEVLNFNGDSGVFLQYTHARLHNLLDAFKDVTASTDLSEVNYDLIADPVSLRLVQHLARYDEVLLKSYIQLEACHVVQYLFTLGRLLNLSLSQLKVKNQPNDVAVARLFLFKSSLQTIKNGLNLLGIKPMNQI